ncbi:hypothetical protein EW026_g5761 [Hermanssonia centrifuga]|uniref:Mixed lineage kinase domain-containing protein n=1 Tax=Hermanssonia centrifuga TaxID=98765 RepID=A0A4V3X9Y5_9APHY|nr:hypothetical protein EW026_g5761 [Hermanssonia centrifuga]
MSSTKSSRAASRREFYARVLDQVKFASDLLSSIGDIGPVNVPVLKGVAELVGNIVTVAQTMITNKEDCVGLVEEISGYLDTITDALKGKDIESVDPAFKNTVDKFKRELEKISEFVQKLSSRSWASRFAKNAEDKRKISGYKANLEQIFRNVNLAGMIHIKAAVEQVRHDIGAFREEMRNRANSVSRDDRVTATLPIPARLYGRDEVILGVVDTVISPNKRHAAILGAGGIGKTSVALTVLHHDKVKEHFTDENRFFIPCDAIKSSHGLADTVLSIMPGSSHGAKKDSVTQLMERLRGLAPVILVLDNFETIYYGPDADRESVQNVLQHMSDIPRPMNRLIFVLCHLVMQKICFLQDVVAMSSPQRLILCVHYYRR